MGFKRSKTVAISSRYWKSNTRSSQEVGRVAVRFSTKFQLVSLFIDSSDNVAWFLIVCTPKTLCFVTLLLKHFCIRLPLFSERKSHTPTAWDNLQLFVLCSPQVSCYSKKGISILGVVSVIITLKLQKLWFPCC
jgi:hypothetical protein